MARQHVLKLEAATFKVDFKSLTCIRTVCKLIWSKLCSDLHKPSKKKKLCCLYFFKVAIVQNMRIFFISYDFNKFAKDTYVLIILAEC